LIKIFISVFSNIRLHGRLFINEGRFRNATAHYRDGEVGGGGGKRFNLELHKVSLKGQIGSKSYR